MAELRPVETSIDTVPDDVLGSAGPADGRVGFDGRSTASTLGDDGLGRGACDERGEQTHGDHSGWTGFSQSGHSAKSLGQSPSDS